MWNSIFTGHPVFLFAKSGNLNIRGCPGGIRVPPRCKDGETPGVVTDPFVRGHSEGWLLVLFSHMLILCGNGTFQQKRNSDEHKQLCKPTSCRIHRTQPWADWSPWLPLSDLGHVTEMEKRTSDHQILHCLSAVNYEAIQPSLLGLSISGDKYALNEDSL